MIKVTNKTADRIERSQQIALQAKIESENIVAIIAEALEVDPLIYTYSIRDKAFVKKATGENNASKP